MALPACSSGSAASSAPTSAGQGVLPITLVTSDAQGDQVMTVPVSINGGAPIPVALDTGSVGLRVFRSALGSTAVKETSIPVSTTYGGGGSMGAGLTWSGVEALATVEMGGVATAAPIAFQLVTQASCPGWNPPCGDTLATNHGVGGTLGVGLRARGDAIADIFSPIAQLPAPWSDGFVVHLSGGAPGQLLLGPNAGGSGWPSVVLSPDKPSRLANGLPAWADVVPVCFAVNGAPTDPPCSTTYIDTGATSAIVSVAQLPAGAGGGALPPGATFEASDDAGLDLRFTVGPTPTSGDRVTFYSGGYAVSSLGVPLFERYDVAYDIRGGHIAFMSLAR